MEPDEVLPVGPIPEAVLRRERRWAAGLLMAIVALGTAGYLSIPTEEDLVITSRTAADPFDRVRAMNALIRRGYWEDRAFKEFEAFMKASPKELPQFMADMHGDMLKSDRRAWKK
ncbi:hypothetical protein Poly30_23300 [Planctomycetes bacterium Poly30]|uniref:Uncharacterized protein n=1 Tax=Saltatorellus ferox TaxID=2528018 RepID=A0A518ERY5_9BACT|nr:hypothetical protein Poly30_23300 [Planctomycetes bacterium Poly30]